MKLNPIFSSHMVFAAKKPIRIYGTGEGKIKITFAHFSCETLCCDGKWMVEFPPMEYGGPFVLCVQSENELVELCDIYVGKVFLFSGQSNMQFKLCDSNFPCAEYKTNELVRFFCTDRIEASDFFTAADGWIKCEKENAGNFSAIGYISSQIVSERDKVAVGVVACYQGASVIESWLPAGTYEKLGIELPIEKKHIVHVDKLFTEWNEKDGTLYERAFSQVVPFSFSAVIWYQGESDATVDEAAVYDKALCELIDVWRNDLCDKELDFVIVQIADYDKEAGDGWTGIQKAQEKVAGMREKVCTVISRDVCETDNIHPQSKTVLSQRIAEKL